MKKIICIILLIISSQSIAQYNMQWYRTYDYPSTENSDYGEDVVQDNFGNIYVTGGDRYQDGDQSQLDYTTIKYSASGNTEWVRRYNFSAMDYSSIIGIDSENNIYVTGISDDTSSAGYSIATIKYNSNGDQIWVRRYSDSNYLKTNVTCMKIDINNNIYLSGYSHTNNSSWSAEIVKYNSNGELLWFDSYSVGQNSIFHFNSIAIDSAGNVFATGGGYGGVSVLTIKYDSLGNRRWIKTNSFNLSAIGIDVEIDKRGNIYVAALSRVFESRYDIILIKYDPSGNVIRSRGQNRYNSFVIGNEFKIPNVLMLDSKDNVYLNFTIFGNGEIYTDLILSKYDSSCNLSWSNLYDFIDGYLFAKDMEIDNNDYIYAIGSNTTSFYNRYNSFVILKCNSSGILLNEIRNNDNFTNTFIPSAISINMNEDIVATGYCFQKNSEFLKDYFTIKYSHTNSVEPISNSIPLEFKLDQNYPNPFNPETVISYQLAVNSFVTLKVYDVIGKEVITLVNEKKSPGKYSVEFDGSNLSNGIYFYKIESGKFVSTKKMLLIK
ncbi:MAG: T9SS type A sorting domain-containing protein [Bacteroidota bacterium]|nr:T9SS type A sorting domain-containing protein [Bacteroidota bacterium]